MSFVIIDKDTIKGRYICTCLKEEVKFWCVGYFLPTGTFYVYRTFEGYEIGRAEKLVNELNGGAHVTVVNDTCKN